MIVLVSTGSGILIVVGAQILRRAAARLDGPLGIPPVVEPDAANI